MTAKYPWEDLQPHSGFVIEQPEWISDLDQQVLLYLYQPIIGPVSFALYYTLFGAVDKDKYISAQMTHADIMEQLIIGKEQFVRARLRLEAIGLLQVYKNRNEQSQLVNRYVLQAPLSADNFFTDSIMSTLLLDRMGEQKYEKLIEKFSMPIQNHQDWIDVTATFQDVYRLPNQLYLMDQTQEEQLVKTGGNRQPVKLSDADFSMPYFVELLQGSFVGEKAVTPEVREMTLALNQLYGYDEVDLQRFALAATNMSTNTIDTARYQAEALRAAEERSISTRNNGLEGKWLIERSVAQLEQADKLQTEQRELWKKQGLSDADLAFADLLKKYPPVQFVRSIKEQRGGYLTKGEGNILQDLMKQGILSPATLNVMAHYYLVEQENNSLSRALMEKTTDDWGQNNINSPEAAMLYLRGRLDKQKQAQIERIEKQKYNNYRSRGKQAGHVEVKPDWFNDSSSAKIKAAEKSGSLPSKTRDSTKEAELKALIASRRKEKEGEQ